MLVAKTCLLLALAVLATVSGGRAEDRVQAVSSANGRLEVFVRQGSGDGISHVWQTEAESGARATHWQWGSGDIALRGDDFVAGRDSAGRLFVAAIEHGVIRINAQPTEGSAFGQPWSLDTHDLHGLRVAANADGRVEFFSVSEPGAAWSTAETQTGNRIFANHLIGGTRLHSVWPTQFRDGRLALVALGGDKRVWWTSQLGPNADWDIWSPLLGHDIQAVVAGSNADGRLDVIALGEDKALYQRYELVGGGWSEWVRLADGPLSEPISMVSNADGRLEVFLQNEAQQIIHAWQVAPNGGWNPFVVLDVIPANTHANSVTQMPDGRLVIAAVADGDDYPLVHIAGQVQANGAWEAWSHPPISRPPPPPKPSITFTATPNDCYGPIGFTCTFNWSVTQCGGDCTVSMVGKTGVNYSTVFFKADDLPRQGRVDVKPVSTNTMFTLSALSPAGGASKNIEGKWEPGSAPDTCAGCMLYFFKLVPPSSLLPCSKKSFLASNKEAAEAAAKAEFPGWTVSLITESEFLAVGC